jgi:hypothetical protein
MREGCRNRVSLCDGTAWVGHGGRAPLLGTLKDMLSKAVEWASVSTGAPLLGNMYFEMKRYIKRYVKMPCKWVSVSIGAAVVNLGNDLLAGSF